MRALFLRKWKKFVRLFRRFLDFEKALTFLKAASLALDQIPWIFEGYETLAAEEPLFIAIDETNGTFFKGFIDLVLQKDGKIVIVDLKTAKSAATFRRYLDDTKRMQLALYRHFYAKKHAIDPQNIETAFVVIEKTPGVRKPSVVFIEQPEDLDAASMAAINETLATVAKNEFSKNRTACYNPFTKIRCPFFQTEHCK